MSKGKNGEANFQSVIQNCKSILVKNMVPCQELFDKLSEFNVFGDSMIHEIKVSFQLHFITPHVCDVSGVIIFR